MTTDTVAKTATREGSSGYTIGGMAKGAGMLAPGLATMLVVITTDAKVDREVLDQALRASTSHSFDRLDTDGCMSTNDTVILMSSGAHEATVDTDEFTTLLRELCLDLMHQLHVDAEGAHHDIAITTQGAASEDEAVEVSRSVSRSALFKAAIFGQDPNWGRVVAQVGTTSAAFDPTAIDVIINGTQVCRASGPYEDPEKVVFDRNVDVVIDLHAGAIPPRSGPRTSPTITSKRTAPTPHEQPTRHVHEVHGRPACRRPGQGRSPDRGAAVDQDLRRCHDRHQVRWQRDDLPGAAAVLRR